MKYKFNKWWGLGLGILDLVFLILALIIFSLVEKNIDGEISIWIGLPILCLVHLPFWFLAGYWAEKSLIEEDEQKKKKTE